MDSFYSQVINLDRSADRQLRISRRLTEEGIDFHRLPATDGRTLSPVDIGYYSAFRCVTYYGRQLSSGEIGCFRSHQRAAEAFLASGQEFGLVLEDDAEVPINFRAILGELSEHLQRLASNNWELVNLGNAPKHESHFKAASPEFFGVKLVRAYVFPKRTTALVWSRYGAQCFLNETMRMASPS